MTDLSATRPITSITTESATFSVGTSYYPDCFEKITITEKVGEMAWIIWYRLWVDGVVVKEINSRFVVAVDYEYPQQNPIPF